MPHPAIESLLILQDRDIKRLALEAQLKAIPGDIGLVERKIATEKGAIEAARMEMRDLEVKKKALENDIGSAGDKLARYRTQQVTVRKNDEYQALGHEIDTTQGQISELEGKELEIMYAIDEAKKKFVTAEAELKTNIAGHEARIAMLREREASLTTDLKAAQAEVATARSPIAEPRLKIYDRIATRTMPAVVAIVAASAAVATSRFRARSSPVRAAKGLIRPSSFRPAISADESSSGKREPRLKRP